MPDRNLRLILALLVVLFALVAAWMYAGHRQVRNRTPIEKHYDPLMRDNDVTRDLGPALDLRTAQRLIDESTAAVLSDDTAAIVARHRNQRAMAPKAARDPIASRRRSS